MVIGLELFYKLKGTFGKIKYPFRISSRFIIRLLPGFHGCFLPELTTFAASIDETACNMTNHSLPGYKPPRILLTGGSGFLGKAIVKELLDAGSPLKPALLRIFDLVPYPGPPDERIEMLTGDICDASAVNNACRDIDLVIHAAALVDWGTKPEKEVLAINFGGTENIVNGCLANRVRHLVYTSSLDAVFGGKSLVNIDESIPYPAKHPNMYCRSKYLSEKLVMGINGKDQDQEGPSLTTCVLRPADIYGEGDPFHIGSLINMAKGGFYVRLGDGSSKSQHVYAGNMAWAHVLAAKALLDGNLAVAGKAYFITDGLPSNFFTFFDRIVEGAGFRIWPKNIWIPRNLAYVMGLISEGIALTARPVKKYAPKFSRFAVIYTCSDFTFTSDRALQDFNFLPKYSGDSAFHLTTAYYRKQKS